MESQVNQSQRSSKQSVPSQRSQAQSEENYRSAELSGLAQAFSNTDLNDQQFLDAFYYNLQQDPQLSQLFEGDLANHPIIRTIQTEQPLQDIYKLSSQEFNALIQQASNAFYSMQCEESKSQQILDYLQSLQPLIVKQQTSEQQSLQEDPRRTFVTEAKHEDHPEQPPYSLHDLLFPGGKISKLCKIPDPKQFRIAEVLSRFKLTESNPVIMMSGNNGDQRSRLLIGMVRAAINTDAYIIDNGMKSGIEIPCYRKKVKLMGVCPEDIIVYPTKGSTGDRLNEITAGHSHLFTVGQKGDRRGWNSVLGVKFDLIDRLRKGRGGHGNFNCRALCLVVGDSNNCLGEVEMALKQQWPVLVLEVSPLGQQIRDLLNGQESHLPPSFQQAASKGRIFMFPDDGTAEHLASAVHLHLVISL